MTHLHGTRLLRLSLLALVVGRTVPAQTPAVSPSLERSAPSAAPTLSIESPTPGPLVQGVAIIRFRVENVSIASLFAPDQQRVAIPAHLHVSVDGAVWHWVHSTSDPIVIAPLSAGEHTVTVELAGADHRPLETRSVRFTVIAKGITATDHAAHPSAPTSTAQPSLAAPGLKDRLPFPRRL